MKTIAEIKGISCEEVVAVTESNALKVLGWFENKNIENTQRDFSKDKRYFIIDNINVNLLLFKV
mgnify:CR=1 FL=1